MRIVVVAAATGLLLLPCSTCLKGTPVLQPFSFPHDLTSGEDAIFRCVVKSGIPPYHFRWLKDDQDVSVTERLTTSVLPHAVRAAQCIVADDIIKCRRSSMPDHNARSRTNRLADSQVASSDVQSVSRYSDLESL
ncbi:hypothetical protein MTO96_031276 [Rhipicephalus appendiculatus]